MLNSSNLIRQVASAHTLQSGPAAAAEQTAKLLELLGVELPFIQAPMAGCQGHALAAAVCGAGALGSIPCAQLSPAGMTAELSAFAAAAGGSAAVNVNFFCHRTPPLDTRREAAWRAALSPYYAEMGISTASIAEGVGRVPFSPEACDALEQFRPRVVSFHFGLPSPSLLQRVKAMGCKVLSSATTVEEGVWLEANGVDAVIAQGLEAGGHRGHFLSRGLGGQAGTFALVPQIVRAVRVPIIAAGGIACSRGVAAALKLGAAGVQVGTAYLLCPEATSSPVHRAAVKAAAAELQPTTEVTNLFTGWPARGVVNRLIRELGPMSKAPPEFPLAVAAIAPLRARAEAAGSGDFSPLWVGQNLSGCREAPAAEITRELASGLRIQD